MPFNKHAGNVTAPVASDPSKTLTQILWAALQSRLYLSFLVILHGNLPVVRIHPPGDKVVVVGIELTSTPFLVGEAVGEGLVLENITPVRYRSARKTRQATVNVQTRRTIKVAPLQVRRTQKVPNAEAFLPSQSLRCAHTTHPRVLEWCQHPLKDLAGPNNIVVNEHRDRCAHFRNGPTHLPALIGLSDAQNTNLFGID